jgi:DNA-binding transcriptional ArsR family regulator
MAGGSMRDHQLHHIAHLFKVLGETSRLKLLQVLMQRGELSVSQLVATTDLSQANASKQLKALLQAQLIAARKEGNYVFYRIQDPLVTQLCQLCCQSVESNQAQMLATLRKTLEVSP